MNESVLNIIDAIVSQPEGLGPSSEFKVPVRRIHKFKITDERDNS